MQKRVVILTVAAGAIAIVCLRRWRRRSLVKANPPQLHLVATDMDGTFLSTPQRAASHVNGELTTRSIQMVQALTSAGVVFAIATGRPAPALQPHVDALGSIADGRVSWDGLPCMYVISRHDPNAATVAFDPQHASSQPRCFNGAAVLLMAPSKPPVSLWQRPLEKDVVRAVIAFAEREDLCLSYSLFDRAIARCVGPAQRELLERFMVLEGVKQQVVSSADELLALPPPLKIVLLVPSSPDTWAAAARDRVGGVHVVSAEMHIEFLAPGVHKGAALDWLCERHGLPTSAALSFGDNMNDIEMLKASGQGVAVSNARDAVKAAADLTLEWSNNEDGVARHCERLLAEGRLQGLLGGTKLVLV